MSSDSIRESLWPFFLTVGYLLACCGCETKTAKTGASQSTSPLQSPTSLQSTADQTTKSAAANGPTSSGSKGADLNGSSYPGTSAQSANEIAVLPTTTGVETQLESVRRIQPEPTPEQIARWKPVAFEPLQLLDIRNERNGYIASVESVGDGAKFVTSGAKLMLWSVDRSQPPVVLMETPPKGSKIISCKVSSDGASCIVLQEDNWCRVFNLSTGKEAIAKQLELKYPERLSVSIDAGEIAILCRSGKLTLWKANDLMEKARWEIAAGEVSQFEYIRENVLVVAGNTTSAWDTTTGKLLKTFTDKSYHQCAVKARDSSSWISLGADAFILWRCADDAKLGTVNAGYATSAVVQFSPDAKRLAALDSEKIQLWDIARNQVLQTIDHTGNTPVSLSWLPNTNLLVVATFDGNLRFWGDAATAKRSGLTVVAAPPVAISNQPGVPATTVELLAALDLRSLARFPGTKMPVDNAFQAYGTLPTSADESRLYYRHLFEQLGWSEVQEGASEKQLFFEKTGFRVEVSIHSAAPQETNVGLWHLGNISTDWIPKMDVGNVEVKNRSNSSLTYSVNAPLLLIECELLEKLHAAGWTAIDHLMQRASESGDERDLNFLWNGCHLRVMISPDVEHNGHNLVSFILRPNLNTLPFATDSGLVEFNDFRELQMISSTKLSLPQATAYFDLEMMRHGWTSAPLGRKVSDELCWLPFYQGQRDITIELVKMADERTRIVAGKYSNSSWQVLPIKGTASDEEKTTNVKGMQAGDFPILEASSPVTYDEPRNKIRFELNPKIDLLALNEKYIAKFIELGWSPEPMTAPTTDGFNMMVKHGQEIIYLSVTRNAANQINAHADSRNFLWTKPIPIQNSKISYINWLKQKRAYATLSRIDEFRSEMNK